MIKPLTMKHLDISENNTASIIEDSIASTNLKITNTSGFNNYNFIVIGKYGISNAEIVEISSKTDANTLVLTDNPIFPHSVDETVTYIPYNKIRIYRSVTGIGGSYSLLAELAIQVDQDFNTFRDVSSDTGYSYKYSFYNSVTEEESDFSNELPFAGFSDWSLKALQDGILSDFGDEEEKTISRSDIKRWLNYFNLKVQTFLMGGESPYFVDFIDVTSTGVSEYDLDTYKIISILMIELSFDGGLNFTESITPKDFRFRDGSSGYDYRIAGNKLIFTDLKVPKDVKMRIWYSTLPVRLESPTDELLTPLIPMLETFYDYGMMRCHLKDRHPELAGNHENKVSAAFNERTGILYKLKRRIKQGGMPSAGDGPDFFGEY